MLLKLQKNAISSHHYDYMIGYHFMKF